MKEAGIENEVLKIIKKFNIKSFFLLDVEMPYLYLASSKGNRNIAVRFSEYEPIELSEFFVNLVDWVWIDTVNSLPLNKDNVPLLKKFKSCLVCPERWGRIEEISNFKKSFQELNFYPNAVMTSFDCIKFWQDKKE